MSLLTLSACNFSQEDSTQGNVEQGNFQSERNQLITYDDLKSFRPQAVDAFPPDGIEIASRYPENNAFGCDISFGPLGYDDIDRLLHNRTVRFRQHNRKNEFNIYVNDALNNSSLCGTDNIGCNKVSVCLDTKPQLSMGGFPVIGRGARFKSLKFRDGFTYRIESCEQFISKHRSIQIFPSTIANFSKLNRVDNRNIILANALFLANEICEKDEFSIIAGRRSNLSINYKNDPFRNITVEIFKEDPNSHNLNSPNVPRILRVRTSLSQDPGRYVAFGEYFSSIPTDRMSQEGIMMPDVALRGVRPEQAASLTAINTTQSYRYIGKDVRAWNIYDKIGADSFLEFYRGKGMTPFRTRAAAGSLVWLNSVGRERSADKILEAVEKSLQEFIDIANVAEFARSNRLDWQDTQNGQLYTLFVINRARSKHQPASIGYDPLNLQRKGFERSRRSSAAFHAIGLDASLVEKWVHADGREYVFLKDERGNGSLVFDGLNDGTFNYCQEITCHLVLDVFPWILWGATTRDTSTPEERAMAFRNAFTGLTLVKGGLDKLSDNDL